MNNNMKMLICCLAMAALCSYTPVRSDDAVPVDTDNIAIGKVDPFRQVELKPDNTGLVVQQTPSELPLESPEMFIESVMLKFLTAKDIELVVSNLLSDYGKMSTDEETNSLVICDTRKALTKIIEQIRKADQTPRQILVEVVILDVKLNDDTEIGVNWNDLFVDATPSSPHTLNYGQTLSTLTTGGSFNLIQNSISVTVKALQKVRNVEILASPRVLVVSGKDATIQTIEEIPYEELSTSTGGVGGSDAITSTVFKTAGITLKVKATITDDGKILMRVQPEQSVDTGVPGLDSRVPIVDRRVVDTTLLLDDGQTVALGGLRRKDTKISQEKIPLLGDLPLLGFLFSSDKVVVTESELLVLISPQIYDTGPKPTDEEMQKYNELRDKPLLTLPREKTMEPQLIPPRPEFELMQKWMTVPAK